MSNLIPPSLRTYSIGEYVGAVAEFPSPCQEYLKIERFGEDTGINWTTDLDAQSIPGALGELLMGTVDVEIWHKDRIETLPPEEAVKAIRIPNLDEIIRLTYLIDKDKGNTNSLLIAWRITNDVLSAPFQLGTLTSSGSLETPRNLIAITATENVKAAPSLVDDLLKFF